MLKPKTPLLAATADPAGGRMLLDVTTYPNVDATGTPSPGTQSAQVEYSTDGGASWTLVRFADGFELHSSHVTRVFDFEVAAGGTHHYRARAFQYDSTGRVYSDYSAVTSKRLEYLDWYVGVPLLHGIRMKVEVDFADITFSRTQQKVELDIIDRKDNFVLLGPRRGRQMSLPFRVRGAAYDRLEEMLDSGQTVLVQSPVHGRQWYMTVGSTSETWVAAKSVGARAETIVTVELTETRRP